MFRRIADQHGCVCLHLDGDPPGHEGEYKARPYHGSMTTFTALSM